MWICTQRALSVASLAMACACATQPAPAAQAPSAELHSLRALQSEQAQHIEELETRIALLEADARSVRSGDPPVRSGDTIRIGNEKHELTAAQPAARPVGWGDETIGDTDEQRSGKRPRLKLYGQKGELREVPTRERPEAAADAPASRANLPTVPTVSETLPVVPLPQQRAAQLRAADASPAAEGGASEPARAEPARPPGESPLASYRAALKLLRERHFDQALEAFSTFIASNPHHALAANALYWRGEAHYAKREYAPALADFEGLLERFPRAEKAADALLKQALCLRQLGSEDKARDVFRRLRTDYPNSQAASMAAREGST
jgi:tol-pal system protein YbgF